MKESSVDLLIIGAGPAGLMAAVWATRYGISYRIIDGGVELRELLVHGDEVLRHGVPLRVVRGQDAGTSEPADDEAELPGEVVGILHGDVHALAGFGGVRVDGVAGEEDPGCVRPVSSVGVIMVKSSGWKRM